MNPAWTAAAAAQLHDGVNLLLSRWAALRMAVENEWGGRDSFQISQRLGQSLFHHLTQSKVQVYMDDLEEMLEECMSTLNTQIGDGSIEEIAEKLMFMREECLEGNFESIKRLKETNVPSVSYSQQPTINDEDDDSIDDEDDDSSDDEDDDNMIEEKFMEMKIDTPQLQSKSSSVKEPAPEAVDGWTVVSRRSKGRKN